MSNYSPPTENLPIFDKNVFQQSDEYITQGDADKRYLRYPNAQGTENLAQINVNGYATFNANAEFNNSSNNNSLKITTNPVIGAYNPCVTATTQQVIAATGTINTEQLVLTTESATNNGIVINNSTVNFTSTSPPTSSQTPPATSDNSNKIPTTAWVQSLFGTITNTVYSVLYYTNQTIVTPANCYAIDVLCVGAGGNAGTSTIVSGTTYWGGSGSGGNTISCSNIPMFSGESLILALTTTSGTGSTTLTRNTVILCRAFNGNAGSNGALNTNAAGGTSNSTIGVGDTTFGSWYNTFGNAGAASSTNGTTRPNMTTSMISTPKGRTTWSNGGLGCGQQTDEVLALKGVGYVVITYHLGI